ncbi:NAD-dependent deacylase [Gilvimarinus agarilyticus]|uniref:SIR2 family NAD-dependent protein deacylase n=1 Tax=Reichenbachiella TaxID=156993 RepID=UPI000E6C2846|nr:MULTISPECIES: NAD-dependent deacylase [Reichenbachiella]MBU2884929.1 NAD-dependent deacylase [Gilvimarinus agarilyticus]MBU2913689.1 NAD-dependent deacylase [Reichenbachiella agariperforans]RJE74362.1 NAD-dependent protein deacylase [Reichenbachiella sp. MSK19-1]
MKRVVVLTGAGISAESGIRTFRDSDGLWEGHDVMEVASPQGWAANQELVMDFYNQRRKQAMAVQPNLGHFALAELEKDFEVTIVTQNVDGLHERAGSSRVIHLHGELSKVRSSVDESIVFELEGWELKSGDLCPKGSQLRPHIVWFGEMVPMMDVAIAEVRRADILLVVGTSLVVYPAASLMSYTRAGIPKYVIDPKMPELPKDSMLYCVEEKASTGVAKVADELRKRYQ